jgi:hypothetical protein
MDIAPGCRRLCPSFIGRFHTDAIDHKYGSIRLHGGDRFDIVILEEDHGK